MQLNLITLSTVKTQLGITDSTYDANITALIPIVSGDVRRILNNNFDRCISATITNGAATLTFGTDNFYTYEYFRPPLVMGQVVYSPGIPADTYLYSYDPDTGIYTMSAAATADGDYVYPTLTVAQWPTVSKMIWYRYTTQTTANASAQNYASISYGPVSKTFADSEINKKYNYPQVLIDDLGVKYAVTG